MSTIQNSQDLLSYLLTQANSDKKDWFGFKQQRIAGIDVAYKMAVAHGDKMSPDEIAQYVKDLNDAIYNKLIRA